jgi:biotin carboxylase
VLIIAATTGYQTRTFAETARRIGISVTMATDRCHVIDDPWGDQALPLRFDQPVESAHSLSNTRADGIVGLGDRPAWIAAMAAEELGLRFHPAAAASAAINKKLTHERFSEAGLLVAENYLIPTDLPPDSARFYPCVLKPLCLSASRGVIRANDAPGFLNAATSIRRILQQPEVQRLHDGSDRFIQVERYIEGSEFALEGLVTQGQLQTLAIFDKPDPLEGPYFEETIYVTPSRQPEAIQREMEIVASRAAAALGLSDGPVHAEMRINSQGIFVLEVAPRPIGGLCAKTLRFPGGVPLEEVVLRHAMGEKIPGFRAVPAAVMMIPIPRAGIYKDTFGVREALKVCAIEDVIMTAKPGQELFPLPEGASYLGFIFARGAEAEQAVRDAHACLRFEISRTLSTTKG